MPARPKHDSSMPHPGAVLAAQERIARRSQAPDLERDQRIDAALSKLKYGSALPAGYEYDGRLLRLR